MFCGRRQTHSHLGSAYFVTLICVGGMLWAQDASTGALRGIVVDSLGAAIPRADIVAIRVDTGIRYYGATDSEGRFKLDLLPPGEYSARAEAERMAAEVNAVGGKAKVVATLDEARLEVGNLLTQYAPRSALCWQHPLLPRNPRTRQ